MVPLLCTQHRPLLMTNPPGPVPPRTGSPSATMGSPLAANADAAGASVAAPRRHPGATCHEPFDWTKPYVAATTGLLKTSGWLTGLIPDKLHCRTLDSPPYCAQVVEAVPKTA